MKRDLRLYYQDILDSIDLIEKYVEKKNYWKFRKDKKIVDAVIRRIEVIGEAIRMIPTKIKNKTGEIPWGEYVQSRNFLIHVYFGVNELRLWNMIKEDMPLLKRVIKKLSEEDGRKN